ncbi:MAG: radical SAM protein [Clostridiales bacterium]|nr:radical SAM protein [Clostridiales bacterium]
MKHSNKKNIYMVQVDLAYGESEKAVYLPYAIGLLAAYAWQDDIIKNNYKIGEFVFTRDDIDDTIDTFENPYLVGFSNYVWNFEYNKVFAERLKKQYPECLIVFGGHNVPPDTSLLEDCPYIDMLIHGEGEEAFKSLLLSLHKNESLADVLNISYRDEENQPVSTTKVQVSCPLDDYPSPYLSGLFDSLMEKNSQYTFCAILETSRDCPFGCAFCDWGQLRSKTRRFSKEQAMQEIEWFSKHKIAYIWGADPNFGMFDDDIEMAKSLIDAKQNTGYPLIFNVNYSKTKADNVFLINKLLNESKMSRGVPLSFQSFSPVVLKNICRENMNLKDFSGLIAKYNEAGVTTYSELIIGLPGETYESFCRGIGILFEAGQHKTVNIYSFELLCNSSLGSPESIEKYEFETVRIPLVRLHCAPESEDITEYSNVVISNNSMNRDMWKRSSLFYNSIQCFHNFGLLRCFAIYLYYEHGIKYEDFYMQLQKWMESNSASVCGQIYQKLNNCYDGVLAGKGGLYYSNPVFGHIVWAYSEAMYLDIVLGFEDFYKEIESFLRTFGIEQQIYSDLLGYQKIIIKRPHISEQSLRLNYNFYDYFSNVYQNEKKDLEQKENKIRTKDPKSWDTWIDYARENVWWGRNENRNIISDIKVEFI